MVKVAIVFYSTYGHLAVMAKAVAEGVKSAGHEAVVLRVPETLNAEALAALYATEAQKSFADIPIATPEDLEAADAIIFGSPTRFGMMAAQMKIFLDSLGKQWAMNSFVGKLASVFTSTATQHGGQEGTILSFHTALLHFGFVIAGLPYTFTEQKTIDEITGGSPYGASTITGGMGQRMPSENELKLARHQGSHIATTASYLVAGKASVGAPAGPSSA